MTPSAAEVTVIADLHLGAGRESRTEEFEDDARLAAFLDTVAERAAGGVPSRLVLLGDIVDFPRIEPGGDRPDRGRLDSSATAACEKVRRAAAGHPAVLDGLRAVVSAGAELHLLPGNHDLEWGHAEARAELERLIGAPVAFHPWVLHLPGVLYAEHGSQHHDLNRLPSWTAAVARPDRAPVPAGTLLDERRSLGGAAGARAVARGLVRLARRPAAPGLMRAHAADTRLPAEALTAIDAAGPAPPPLGLALTARRLLAREPPGAYMEAAARRVDATLRAHGAAVPFVVLAHTHVPTDIPLPGTGARYLNPGPWARFRPAGRGGTAVRITIPGGRPPTAELLEA